MNDDQATARVVARAAVKNVAVVTMEGAKVQPTPSHQDTKVTQRRRDPSRPGHFLDDAPVSASAQASAPEPSQSPRVEPSATAPISAQPARLGPYSKLGDKPLADRQPGPAGPDAFLSQSAFDALEGWVNSMVDARLASRTEGANAKATQERATAARDQFTANFVKK